MCLLALDFGEKKATLLKNTNKSQRAVGALGERQKTMLKHPFIAVLCLISLFVFSFTSFAEEEEADAEEEETDSSFPWFSLAPEVGFVSMFKSEVRSSTAEMAVRQGVVVKGHVDLGGDGIALELAPLYSRQVSDEFPGDFHVLGGEITLVFRFSIGDFYPSLGLGFHGAYVFGNEYISSGVELYGRIPVGVTWYFVKYLGLVVEAGFLFGGTGVKTKSPDESITGTQAEELARLAGSLEFGPGFGLDILVGLRFP